MTFLLLAKDEPQGGWHHRDRSNFWAVETNLPVWVTHVRLPREAARTGGRGWLASSVADRCSACLRRAGTYRFSHSTVRSLEWKGPPPLLAHQGPVMMSSLTHHPKTLITSAMIKTLLPSSENNPLRLCKSWTGTQRDWKSFTLCFLSAVMFS